MFQNKTIGYFLAGFSIILVFILTFVKIDSDEQSAFLCEKFHENQLDMQQCPAHKSNISWLLVSAFGIGFLILGVGVYLSFFHKPAAKDVKDFKEIDITKLTDEEKNIYGIIRNKSGSAYQSDLMKETGFSKVKVTRLLDKLESKVVLERKRRGMTNIIVLK
ncbi:MAG: hypothetical protein AABX33_05140 [Nanoarchaeota archaeon]